jgi:multidrug efflux pump subunit AcrA (membrane-fusion protein)
MMVARTLRTSASIFAVFSIIAMSLVPLGCKKKESDGAKETPKPKQKLVVVRPVPEGVIRSFFTVPSMLEPIISVTLSAQTAGQVMQVPVNEGEMVAAGQVLAAIDDREYQALFNQLNAQYAAQQAQIAKLKQYSRPQEIKVLQAQVESARVALENAERELERANSLFDAGVIPLSQVEKARTAKEAAQAAYTTAAETLDLALEGSRQEDIAAAEAILKSLEAQLQQVSLQMEHCYIKAPIEGVISKVYVEPSETVSPGKPVCGLVNLSQLVAKVGLSESDLIAIKLGSTVVVRLNLAPDQPLPGVVMSIAPAVDPEKGTFQVEVNVPNPGGQILGGFYANIEFTRALAEKALIVPVDALINEGEQWYVFVVSAGRAERRDVIPGIMTPTHAQIVKGLEKGELIVVTGQRLLASGDFVDVTETLEPSLPEENKILAELQAKQKDQAENQSDSLNPSETDLSGKGIANPNTPSVDTGADADSGGEGSADKRTKDDGASGDKGSTDAVKIDYEDEAKDTDKVEG